MYFYFHCNLRLGNGVSSMSLNLFIFALTFPAIGRTEYWSFIVLYLYSNQQHLSMFSCHDNDKKHVDDQSNFQEHLVTN